MSSVPTPAALAPVRLPPPERVSGFFAHHGLWAPGVRLFRRINFSVKALIISVALTVPLLVLLALQLRFQYTDAMASTLAATRQQVETAHGVVALFHAQEQAGVLTGDQARQSARQAIATLRYGSSGYFWINDMQARMVVHPIQSKLDGQDVSGMRDPNGMAIFLAFVDTVRQHGEGMVRYQWPKPGQEAPADKLSYVKGFAPWGWVIGSGLYVDDVAAAMVRQLQLDGAILAGTLLVAGYLFVSFYKVINGGLLETRRHLRAMTDGDLTTTPHPWGKDEPAQLMHDLRAMQDALRHMVRRVRHSSQEIVHSTDEIATGMTDLSSRTEQAAVSLEQSAASMEELTATVSHTLTNTETAAQVARQNAEIASEGGRVMEEVALTMEEIRLASARIGEIISTLDGISLQTNLLALNAAVEAARAGEQGRGFAVVAGEVRLLAQRSTQEAREIRGLIASSVSQVETGTAVVRKAGAAISAIVASSRQVNELLDGIAASAREQNIGITQIGQAVHELDRATQHNAALVEQTAAASAAMHDQAQVLSEEVSQFRLPAGMAAIQEAPATAVGEFDFSSAIEAHRQWKVRLRSAIAEHGQLDAQTLCRDDRCPLGQWLHGPGGARWGQRPLFVELMERHATFHRTAADVAQTINRGQYDEARRLIGAGSAFTQVSTEVASLLTRAKREL